MSRISLTEQYSNKDVIAQIYDLKDKYTDASEALAENQTAINNAINTLNEATADIDALSTQVDGFDTRVGNVEQSIGAPADAPSSTGSAFARINKNTGDITTATTEIASMESDVSALQTTVGNANSGLVKGVADNAAAISNNREDIDLHTTQIATLMGTVEGHDTVISTLPTTYQLRSEKDSLNGYAGLSSAGKIATSQIDTGVNLNQVLQAGAQLNPGEFLYVGPGGVIRSRIVGEGVTYVGNYASLAALEAYPSPSNGSFGTVYGSTSDDGFYMFDGANWNKTLLFDATDYELVSNKTTGISSASTDSQYPSAKAVYDYNQANDVANLGVTQTTGATGVTVGVSVSNSNNSPIATGNVLIPTTSAPTSGSNVPLTSGGAYTALAGKQATLVVGTNLDATPTNGSNNPVTSDGVFDALSGKMNAMTIDSAPASGSGNLVTSGGVYTALASKESTLNADQKRKITISTGSPSGGSDGDIWLVYEA